MKNLTEIIAELVECNVLTDDINTIEECISVLSDTITDNGDLDTEITIEEIAGNFINK